MPEFAAAVTCIDGRFHAPLVAWTRDRFGVEHVDLVTTPGASAALAARRAATTGSVLAHLAPSLEAHASEVVVIAAHEGCAADPSDAATQLAALPTAAAALRERLGPDAEVVAVRLGADGQVTEVPAPDRNGVHPRPRSGVHGWEAEGPGQRITEPIR